MKKHHLLFIPISIAKTHGLKFTFILLVLIGLALYSINFIKIDDNINLKLPTYSSYNSEKAQERHYPSSESIKISIVSKNPDSTNMFYAINELTQELEKLKGVNEVLSVTNIKNITISNGTIKTEPLIENFSDTLKIEQTIQTDPLFQKYLTSPNSNALSVYVFLKNDSSVENIIKLINKTEIQWPELSIFYFGYPYLKYTIKNNIFNDFIIIGLSALALILIVLFVITKGIQNSLLLFINSIIPSVLIFPFFIPLDISIQSNTVLLPIITFTISTSYSIHMYRYWNKAQTEKANTLLIHCVELILLTGLTTIIGFGLLIFSQFEALSKFGTILITGIIFSMLSTLFILPYFLSKTKVQKPQRKDFRSSSIFVYIWIVLICLLLAGITMIAPDFRVEKIFKPDLSISKQISHFINEYNGLNQLTLYIDTETEYGVINIDFYRKINEFINLIEKQPETAEILSPIDFINWFEGKMKESSSPQIPENSETLGEDIEFLYTGDLGVSLKSFINIDYSQIRLNLTFDIPTPRTKGANTTYTKYINFIKKLHASLLQNTKLFIIGDYEENQIKASYAITEQLIGSTGFLVIIFLIGVIVFREIKLTFLFLIPVFCGIICYLGIMGWLNVPLNGITALALMSILGISCDDAMHLLLSFKRSNIENNLEKRMAAVLNQSGKPIIETTILLIIGFSVLFFSKYWMVTQIGLLTSVGLGFSTFTCYFILPHFLKKLYQPKEKK